MQVIKKVVVIEKGIPYIIYYEFFKYFFNI